MREFDDEHYALRAAVAGQGLVLASNVLVAEGLKRGELMPYRLEVSLAGPRYVAVCVPGRQRQEAVSAFLKWLAGVVSTLQVRCVRAAAAVIQGKTCRCGI